jgi:hypothetical protein
MTDRDNIMRSKFGKIALFAKFQRAVGNPINGVLAARAPQKIRSGIVYSVAVSMAAFHSFGALPNEAFKDESMNQAVGVFLVSSQRDLEVSRLFVLLEQSPSRGINDGARAAPAGVQSLVSPARPHTTIVTNSVARESDDVSILNSRIGLSHDVTSCKRGSLWSGSAVVSSGRSTRFYFKRDTDA